jgi:hypothetical protein
MLVAVLIVKGGSCPFGQLLSFNFFENPKDLRKKINKIDEELRDLF